MKALTGLQSRFQRYLIDGDPAVVSDIAGPDDGYRHTRLRIYYSAYRLRLIAALAVDYPALKAFVGESAFENLAAAYIDARPSTYRNLRWFGGALSAFLANDPAFSPQPVLAELAEFEWAQGLAFDADDAPQSSFEKIATVPPAEWPGLRFIAHPSLHLIESRWNVIAIWHAHRDQHEMPEPFESEQTSTIAVWRRDFKTYFRTLDRDETWLWHTFAGGAGFGDACADFAAETGAADADAAQRAAGLLRGWVDEGWIQDYVVSAED
jgi:hypothetical protein